MVYTDTDGSASATSAAALPPQCPASSKRESPLKCVGVREVHEAERPRLCAACSRLGLEGWG